MLTLEATKNQKIVLGSILLAFILYLIYMFAIAPAYQAYNEKKDEERKLNSENIEYSRKLIRLQQVREQYLKNEHFLQHATEKLSIDVADLLSLLTKNSPVKNFAHAYLEKQHKEIEESGVIRYPFELEFQSDFKKIGEFLLYQESSLPISFIENIEIVKIPNQKNMLITRISGVIYKVEK
ncbi:type 4a pilus biogenesis protein PilO [candidate division KSB1 bacterium]|nr:type 4a pilus biogenesis protein PilO [candidate division KSB1 bacterium]